MQDPSTPRRMSLAEAEILARRDRRRILLLAIAALVLGGGIFFSGFMRKRYEDREAAELPAQERLDEEPPVFVRFDMPEVLEDIRDATSDDRVVIEERDALAKVLDYGRLSSESQYYAMGVRDLDASTRAAIEADPRAHRVEPYRARGELLALGERRHFGNTVAHQGALRLADGSCAHFIAVAIDEGLAAGDFARVDGVFFKLLRAEVGADWCEGPLLLGRDLVRAHPPLVLDESLAVAGLGEIADDTFESTEAVPAQVEWGLMAKALQGSERIDWESAPELDTELLNKIFQDGDAYRGRAIRLPICRNMGSRTKRVGENPFGLERMTEGWIGNFSWKGATSVIWYTLPADQPGLDDWEQEARYVTGRGFFLKNRNYEQGSGKPGRAPYFIMESIELFVPPEDTNTRLIAWFVLGATLALVLLFWRLLAADKRRALELQQELIRRRRARRERSGRKLDLATDGPTPNEP